MRLPNFFRGKFFFCGLVILGNFQFIIQLRCKKLVRPCRGCCPIQNLCGGKVGGIKQLTGYNATPGGVVGHRPVGLRTFQKKREREMKNLLKLIGALLMLGASSSAYAWVALATPANIAYDQPKVYAIASNGANAEDAKTRAIAACAAANSGNHGCAVDTADSGRDAVFETCIAVVPTRYLNSARNDRGYGRTWASRNTESAAIANAESIAQGREKAGSAVAACSTPGESPTTTTANHQSVLLASSDCSSSETFTNGQCRGSGSWVAIAHRPTYYTDPNAIIVAGYGATEQEARSRAIAACNQEVSQSDCVIRGDDTTPPFPMTGQGCYATIPLRVSVSAGIQYWLPFSIRPTCEAASTAARQGVEANRNDPAVSVLHQGAVITRDSAAAGSATSQPINLASLAPGSGGGGGGGSGGAAIAIGAIAVVGLAAWAFSGTSDEPVETSFAPVAFYEVNDGIRHWNVGTRFNWSQGDWTAYWTATKTSADDRSFLYGTGMNWTGDIFAAKFNSRGIADEARMDFALSADKQFGLWKFSPNYRLDYAKTEADETLLHALTADAVWKSDKWTVRHSVGFHGNSFAAFADKATAKIQLRRDF